MLHTAFPILSEPLLEWAELVFTDRSPWVRFWLQLLSGGCDRSDPLHCCQYVPFLLPSPRVVRGMICAELPDPDQTSSSFVAIA